MTLRNSPKANQPIYIVFIYCLFGSLWILFSDRVLDSLFFNNSQLITQFQTLKGWLFVFLTSGLLYELIRRSQQSLQDSYSLLHAIVEGTTDAIFVKDCQGRYLMVNSTSAQILGHAPHAILGYDDREFLPPENARDILDIDQEIIKKGTSESLEEKVVTGGETRFYWSRKYIWRGRKGEIQGLIGIARDITEHKQLVQRKEQLVEELQQQTNDLRALSAITENGVSTLDLNDLLQTLLLRIVSVTAADAAVLLLYQNNSLQPRSSVGVPESELLAYACKMGQGFSGLVASSSEPIYVEDLDKDPRFSSFYASKRKVRTLLGVAFRRNGRLVGVLQLEWQQVRICNQREIHLLEVVAERCVMAILNAQLYEQTKHLQEQLQLQIERMPIGFILHNNHFEITDWNPAAEGIFGYSKSEVLGCHPNELIIPPSFQLKFQQILRRIVEGDLMASLHENLTKDGRFILCEWHNTPLRAEDGTFIGLLSMVQDVTERERSREQLWRAAYYDNLTNLPNHKLLLERIHYLLEAKKLGNKSESSLIYVDINRFKIIKYTLGHQTAERLLIEVAHRLESCVEPPAILARVDADEFAILLEDVSDLNQAKRFAERIRRQIMRTPFYLNGAEIFTSVSVGLVMSSRINNEPEEMLRAADAAMHRAKINRSNECDVFDAQMQAEATRRLKVDTDLLHIVNRQELQVYYQPIVSFTDNKLIGFEALIRWQHPELGMISPAEFIPIAEENGAIHGIGLWILRQACSQVKQWQKKFDNNETLMISVNLSPIQLKHPQLLDKIEQILEETHFPPHCLKLEITENILLEQEPAIAHLLNHLKAMKIKLCIDDFGIGYSSLSYLHTYPIDLLKIDRSFVTNLITQPKSQEIVRSVIVLAQTLKMNIIAEGIETVEQLEYLKKLGCKHGQGYLFAKPLDSQAAEEFITNNI
ncbi:EAL domain-containing protein [Capilliphycus salinus ALCB114379]|uniref:EAL domain-containing protein n=1 Tax=Capilliphycus salinus TaxID=2768948 RepID=UPI0039A73C1B